MSKTYIAHLPERYIEKRPDGEEWLQMPVNVSGHELTIKTVIPLTPYTEPDLDAIQKKAYEEGHKLGYIAGYEKADKAGAKFYDDGYQRGLKDSWEAARKIVLSTDDGGLFDYETRKAVFGCANYMALKKYTISEAIEKIRQYEQKKQEEEDSKTRIEYNFDIIKGIIKTTAKEYSMSIEEIAEVLRKMQEEKE